MSLDRAQRLADSVLLDGSVLASRRAPHPRSHRPRGQFGVLAPRGYAESSGGERWWMEAQLLVDGPMARVSGRLRFLEVVRRQIEWRDEHDRFVPVARLEIGGREYGSTDEGRLKEIAFTFDLAQTRTAILPFSLAETDEVEPLFAGATPIARVRRRRPALNGILHLRADASPSSRRGLNRLAIRVENLGRSPGTGVPRSAVLPACFASTHLLLEVTAGEFVPTTDPPAWAARAAAECRSVGVHAVVVSERGAYDQMLCSPIVLTEPPWRAAHRPSDFVDVGDTEELPMLPAAEVAS